VFTISIIYSLSKLYLDFARYRHLHPCSHLLISLWVHGDT